MAQQKITPISYTYQHHNCKGLLYNVPTLTLAFKGIPQQSFTFNDGLFTIGREMGCDIHIDSLAIQPLHARVICRKGICTLQDTSKVNDTFVNHKPVKEHCLQADDLIRVGKHTLRFSLEKPASSTVENIILSSSSETRAEKTKPRHNGNVPGWLQFLSGRYLGKTINLKASLTDLSKHGIDKTLVAHRQEGYFISNLGNENSIQVANIDIGEKSWPLQDGDLIQVGSTKLQFYLEQ